MTDYEQGIEVVRNLIAGQQGSRVWLYFLTPDAAQDALRMPLKLFRTWRAVELVRTRPFSASLRTPRHMPDSPEALSICHATPSFATPSLSMSLAGGPAALESSAASIDMVDTDGDGYVDEDEFRAYLAANRTVRYGARRVRICGAELRYGGSTRPYKGVNGEYEMTEEVCNGRAV